MFWTVIRADFDLLKQRYRVTISLGVMSQIPLKLRISRNNYFSICEPKMSFSIVNSTQLTEVYIRII